MIFGAETRLALNLGKNLLCVFVVTHFEVLATRRHFVSEDDFDQIVIVASSLRLVRVAICLGLLLSDAYCIRIAQLAKVWASLVVLFENLVAGCLLALERVRPRLIWSRMESMVLCPRDGILDGTETIEDLLALARLPL